MRLIAFLPGELAPLLFDNKNHKKVKNNLKWHELVANSTTMEKLFVPYKSDKPATLCINGHKLLIVSSDDSLFDYSEAFGKDPISTHTVELNEDEMEFTLGSLAKEIEAGVVLAPTDVALDDLLESLGEELPWIQ